MTRINPKRIVIPEDFHPMDMDPTSRTYKRFRPVEPERNKPYAALVVTVKKDGVLNPVRVRTDAGRIVLAEPGHYYRLMAAKEAGVRDVPTTGLEDTVEPEAL